MGKRALAVTLLLLCASAVYAADYFSSNELGMRLRPIPATAVGSHQWVLKVERTGNLEVRTLTDSGTEYARWEDTLQNGRVVSESYYSKGELASVTTLRDGRPIHRVDYSQGAVSQVSDYTYAGRTLRKVTVSNGDGVVQYTDRYSEGPDGRLRRAVRETPKGATNVIGLDFAGDALLSQWLGSDGTGVLYRYSKGSVIAEQQWSGSKLQSERVVSPRPHGSTSVSTDYSTGLTTKKVFNAAGDLVSELVTKKGESVKSVEYAYADGKIASEITKTPGQREEVRYSYGEGGTLDTVETTVNRQVVKVTRYTGKDTYVEDLYVGGRVVLHVYYEKGKKVREVPVIPGATPGVDGGAAP